MVVGVQWLRLAGHDVGMVLLDNGGTVSRHVQRLSSALLRMLLNLGALLSFQMLTITLDIDVSQGRHGRV